MSHVAGPPASVPESRIPAPDGFRKGRDPFPFRPQRLTQVASRHARVTLASMWLRRAMPYATIDSRVEVDGTCGKSDCGVAATGGVVATSVLTQLLRPAIGRLREENRKNVETANTNVEMEGMGNREQGTATFSHWHISFREGRGFILRAGVVEWYCNEKPEYRLYVAQCGGSD